MDGLIYKPEVGAMLLRDHPLAQGLAGLWLMNEGSGGTVYDHSGNDTHGTLVGGPTWAAGPTGATLAFDGNDDCVTLGNPAHLKLSQFTITAKAWLASTSESFPKIIDWENDTLGWQLYYSDTYTVGVSGTNYAINYSARAEWVTLGVTFDGALVRVYLNGLYKTGAPRTSVNYGTLSDLRIGTRGNDPRHWKGFIDFVSIYNRALTADEVAWLYAEPYCMFTRPDRWLRVFDFGATVVGRAYFGTRNLGAQLLRRTGL